MYDEAAEILEVAPLTITNWINNGKGRPGYLELFEIYKTHGSTAIESIKSELDQYDWSKDAFISMIKKLGGYGEVSKAISVRRQTLYQTRIPSLGLKYLLLNLLKEKRNGIS